MNAKPVSSDLFQVAKPARKPHASQSVFIVDDHPLMLTMLSQIIVDQDRLHVCGTAQNGRDAVCGIFKTHPDLILCDLSLPGMDGYALIRCLRIARVMAPIVVFSSVNETQARAALGGLPHISFASKGCTMEELLDVIRQALAHAGATAIEHLVPG